MLRHVLELPNIPSRANLHTAYLDTNLINKMGQSQTASKVCKS